MHLVIHSGDKVLIPAPYWTSYPGLNQSLNKSNIRNTTYWSFFFIYLSWIAPLDMVKLCHATPIIVPTLASEQYVLSAESLRSALGAHPEVACLILCNPSNPSGCVTTAQQLENVAAVLREYPNVSIIEINPSVGQTATRSNKFLHCWSVVGVGVVR